MVDLAVVLHPISMLVCKTEERATHLTQVHRKETMVDQPITPDRVATIEVAQVVAVLLPLVKISKTILAVQVVMDRHLQLPAFQLLMQVAVVVVPLVAIVSEPAVQVEQAVVVQEQLKTLLSQLQAQPILVVAVVVDQEITRLLTEMERMGEVASSF
jgi:hypothetical protein